MVSRGTLKGSSALLVLCAALLDGACWRGYSVPTGTIGEQYSPHALQGRITAVQDTQLTVESDGGGTTSVMLTADTRLLKVSDGLVLRPELMAGQKVRIWFESPRQPEGSGPHPAAVIMLASLDPRDDWPAR
jgi:hypothetical protein